MKILLMGIEILATILEGYIGIRVGGLFLESRYEQKKLRLMTLVVAAGLAVFVSLLNFVELFSYLTIAFGVISIAIVIFFLYRCKAPFAFFISCFYFICLNYLDFLGITLAGAFLHDPDYTSYVVSNYGLMRIRQMFLCKGLQILVYVCAKHFIKGKLKTDTGKQYVILTLAGGIGVVYLIESSLQLTSFANVKNWILFSVIIVFCWALVLLYEKNKHEEDMVRFMEMRNALLEENYRGLSGAYSANAKVYHDFNNHMSVLRQYLMRSDSKSALEYLDSISEPVRLLMERTWTGNEVIDVIINSKLKKMEEHQIQTKIHAEFPNQSDVIACDICTILGNLLDNAIEACQRNKSSENKWIHLTIRIVNAMLVFKIENGIEEAPQIKNMHLVTSKADERFHGWGLKSVASAVEKYEGVMRHTIGENRFQVVVTLNFNLTDHEQ